MKILSLKNDIALTKREVHCPCNNFVSYRFLIKEDNMGFTMTKTVIPKGGPHFWNYKNHLEACYCVSGNAIITNKLNGMAYKIFHDIMYVLDSHEPHTFEAIEETTLICVLTPALVGNEVHNEFGSYPLEVY